MKKRVLFFIICLLSANLFAASLNYKTGSTVYVSVKSAKLGKNTVVYGDALVVDGVKGKKIKVHLADNSDVCGFIAAGSVTKKKIVEGSSTRTSSDELSLAGKGFSENTENAFKAKNPDLDFEQVDEIEEISVSDADLEKFIKDGELCAE